MTFAALLLAGCGGNPKPQIVTKVTYVAVKPAAEFFDENKCPWPAKADYVRTGTDLEVSDWMLAGYTAWICEHETRMKIKSETERQAKDIEKRNQDEATKSAQTAAQPSAKSAKDGNGGGTKTP